MSCTCGWLVPGESRGCASTVPVGNGEQPPPASIDRRQRPCLPHERQEIDRTIKDYCQYRICEIKHIGRKEGLWRVRAGAEGPRRTADRCRRTVRQAGAQAVQPSLGTRLRRLRSPQGPDRGFGHGGHCGLALHTLPSAQDPAPGRAEQATGVAPGAPKWRAPRRGPSGTPAPGASRHTVLRRTRPARTSYAAARPHPVAASAPSLRKSPLRPRVS